LARYWKISRREEKSGKKDRKKGLWESGNYLFNPYKNGNDARRRKWIFFGFKNI
jgi:hypothetical protein